MGCAKLTSLQLLKAFEGNLELIRRAKRRGVVLDLDTEKRYDRHIGCCFVDFRCNLV